MFSLMHAASLEVGEVESPSLAQVSEDVSYLVEGIDQSGRRCWHGAEAAEDGGTRPRNASTCLLWCAIALGALGARLFLGVRELLQPTGYDTNFQYYPLHSIPPLSERVPWARRLFYICLKKVCPTVYPLYFRASTS